MSYKKYGKFTLLSQFCSLKEFFLRFFIDKDYKLIKREFLYFKQRIFRGWDDSETWNLEMEISEFVYPRLKRYFEITNAAPPLEKNSNNEIRQLNDKEWKIIQKKILYSLNETRLNNKNVFNTNKDYDRIKEGFDLFHKYRYTFWW